MWPDCCFQLALFPYRLRCPFGLRKSVLTVAKPLKFLTERKIMQAGHPLNEGVGTICNYPWPGLAYPEDPSKREGGKPAEINAAQQVNFRIQ